MNEQFIASTISGLEDVAIEDVKEIINSKARKIKKGRIIFDCKDIGELLEKARSVGFVYKYVGGFKFRGLDEIEKKSGKLDYSFIKKDFVVHCKRKGQHDFSSIDVAKIVGKAIYSKGYAVNLRSKNIIIADVMDNDCFIGILMKDEMCKRDYRVKINKQGINACMAYLLLKLSGWKKEDSLLDPNCRDGVILIEAGLIGGSKLYGMESNKPNLISTNINSRLAKVNIELHNEEIRNIEKLFKSVDYIITFLPSESKAVSKNFIRRLYDEFFTAVKNIKAKRILVFVLDDELLKPYLNEFIVAEKRYIEAGLNYTAYLLE